MDNENDSQNDNESINPYEAPAAPVAPEPFGADLSVQGGGEPNLDFGYILGRAWEAFKTNPGMAIGMIFLLYVIIGVPFGLASATENQTVIIITMLAAVVAMPPLMLGLLHGYLKIWRNDSPEIGDLFSGFPYFLPCLAVYFMGIIAVYFGMAFLIVPGVILMLGLFPAAFLVIDRGLGPIEAFKTAWAMTDGYKGEIFIVGLLGYFVMIAGYLAFCVGVIVTMPMYYIMIAGTYDELSKRDVPIA